MVSTEIGPKAREIYESKIRHLVEAGNYGRLVAIDVDSGEYELGDELLGPANILRKRIPTSNTFTIRIGFDAVCSIRIATGNDQR